QRSTGTSPVVPGSGIAHGHIVLLQVPIQDVFTTLQVYMGGLAVILVVPLCLLAAVTGMTIARLPVDIFVQIGLLVLIGLASKNAILIVEFARQLRAEGQELHDATRQASTIRFRPIIMTSFAFILGVLPLVIATGAGAEMRQSLGVAVFSGMIGVTLFGIFLTPVFFFVLMWLRERRQDQN